MVKLQILPPGTDTPGAAELADLASASARYVQVSVEWTLDCAGQRLLGPGGEVLLPALEFRLLAVFRRHPHTVFTREQLLDLVWGRDFAGTDRVVDRAVCWLRRVLEPDPAHPRYLRTRRGAGYSYCPPPAAS